MKIDVRAKDCLYIEIDEWTFYIDNSTNEAIMDKWKTNDSYTEILKQREIEDKIRADVEYDLPINNMDEE